MKVSQKVREALFGSPLYQLTLRGRTPKELRRNLTDPWPGEASLGAAVRRGEFSFDGKLIYLGDNPWQGQPLSDRRKASLDGFGWLRNLRQMGTEEAGIRARQLVGLWIADHQGWTDLPWQPHILGARIANWMLNYQFITARADDAFISEFMASLTKQARHLPRATGMAVQDEKIFSSIRGLIASALCLEGQEENMTSGLRTLRKAIEVQVRPDGGHSSRCPSTQATVLTQLVEIKGILRSAHEMVPENLQQAIDRMAPMLRSFRHGDGRLCLFNGGCEEDAQWLDQLISEAETGGKAINAATHSGFQRMKAGRTLVLTDCGAQRKSDDGTGHHHGPLSFEMSVGKRRLVVNCGAHPDQESEWREALKSTAAHSTMVIDNQDAHVIEGDVSCERTDEDSHTFLTMQQNGYLNRYGLVHHRDLYLSPHGDSLRGEDRLTLENASKARGKPGERAETFKISFHLHPDVQALVSGDGSGVMLRLPHTSGGWRFIFSGAEVSLHESVYHGSATDLRRSEQIVLSGPIPTSIPREGLAVKWAFQREQS